MGHFLFTVWPFPGHVHPNIALAKALLKRGHEVSFYTGAAVRGPLEAEGIRCLPFQRVDEAGVTALVQNLDAMSLDWSNARSCRAALQAWLLETIDAQLLDLRAILARYPTDVIVCDPAMWGPLLVLHETERIPLAIMSYVASCMLPGPEGPILGLALPPLRSPLAAAGHWLLRQVSDLVARDVRRAANAVRARYGLCPVKGSVTAYAGRMPLYLVQGSAEFDRQRRDLPASVHYIGLCSWDKPVRDPCPGWLQGLHKARPLVYVTEGTMHAKEPLLLRAAIAGLQSLPVQVVVTTGRHRTPADLALGTLPANLHIEQWIPHSDLLPHADVVVTTGGTGTVLSALAYGVPLVIMPTAWDQPENARRVAEARAGIRIPYRQCSAEAIRTAVERVLDTPSYRQNAMRLGSELQRVSESNCASRLLEQLLSQPATCPA